MPTSAAATMTRIDPVTRPQHSTEPSSLPDSCTSTVQSGTATDTPGATSGANTSTIHPTRPSTSSAGGATSSIDAAAGSPPPQPSNMSSKKRKFSAKTAFEITVATVAIFGVVWATFVSLPTLKLQKWSAGNDFLQVCLALDSPSIRSTRCNETIEAGPVPPPKWKRDLHMKVTMALAKNPVWLSTVSVLTVALLIATTVYFRPRMQPFHHIVSMARSPEFWPLRISTESAGQRDTLTPYRKIRSWSQIKNGRPGVDITWTLAQQGSHGSHGPDPYIALANSGTKPCGYDTGILEEDKGCGQRIGVWYDSDEELLESPADDGCAEQSQQLCVQSSVTRGRTSSCPPRLKRSTSTFNIEEVTRSPRSLSCHPVLPSQPQGILKPCSSASLRTVPSFARRETPPHSPARRTSSLEAIDGDGFLRGSRARQDSRDRLDSISPRRRAVAESSGPVRAVRKAQEPTLQFGWLRSAWRRVSGRAKVVQEQEIDYGAFKRQGRRNAIFPLPSRDTSPHRSQQWTGDEL